MLSRQQRHSAPFHFAYIKLIVGLKQNGDPTLNNNVERSINFMLLQEGTMIQTCCLNTINAKNAINTSKHFGDLELFS